MQKPNYGFDAPSIMRNLIILGIILTVIGFSIPFIFDNSFLRYLVYLLILVGLVLLILGTSMYFYGTTGKFIMRDYILKKIIWNGNENVLDIGAGTGLLMNGAAKFLTTGKSIGTDIWRAEDLSDNTLENALKNAEIENVSDRIEIRTEDARHLSFENNAFDMVLSMFCINNIDDKAGQEKACLEIARVLKPGGKAFIGDNIPTHDYAKYFKKAGLKVISSKKYISTAYTLMWIVEVAKF
jgi:arsenite methyltransferase